MARRYSISGTDTNTAATTQMTLISATTIRPALYDLLISSVATPADNAAEYLLQRITTAGTVTAVTPQALDPGDPAALASAGVNATAEPTYTSNAVLLRLAGNQRATLRWVAAPGGELKSPATANNGLGLLANAIGGSAFAASYMMHYEE
jgi:hypothetical protein